MEMSEWIGWLWQFIGLMNYRRERSRIIQETGVGWKTK